MAHHHRNFGLTPGAAQRPESASELRRRAAWRETALIFGTLVSAIAILLIVHFPVLP